MITGAPSGAITRRPVSQTRAQLNSVRSMFGFRRTQRNTTMQRPSAISSAGTTEAANSAPVETAGRPAKMTAGMLGGITGAISDGRADDAEREPRSSRPRSIAGISTLPRAAASATAEPLIQEKPEADADADVAEAAAHPAEQREREVEEAVRDARVVGDAAEQDEQRDGEQREAGRRVGHQAQRQAERLVGGEHVEQATARRTRTRPAPGSPAAR